MYGGANRGNPLGGTIPHGPSDAHAVLKEALDARLLGVSWQRCQFYLMENALAYVIRPSMQAEAVASIRAVFDAP